MLRESSKIHSGPVQRKYLTIIKTLPQDQRVLLPRNTTDGLWSHTCLLTNFCTFCATARIGWKRSGGCTSLNWSQTRAWSIIGNFKIVTMANIRSLISTSYPRQPLRTKHLTWSFKKSSTKKQRRSISVLWASTRRPLSPSQPWSFKVPNSNPLQPRPIKNHPRK